MVHKPHVERESELVRVNFLSSQHLEDQGRRAVNLRPTWVIDLVQKSQILLK